MSAPTQLNISVAINNSGTVTTSTVSIPIPAALQSLDSNASYGAGQASQQTGISSADQLVRAIFRAGCFFVAATGTWYNANDIQSISYQ